MKLRAVFIVICSVSACSYTTCVHGAAVAGTVIEVLDGDTVRIMSNRRLPHGQHANVIAHENKIIADKRAVVTTYEVAGEDARYICYQYPDSGREQWYAFQTVRLNGIDAPELSQPGGAQARAALTSKIADRHVVITTQQRDEYGRLLGSVRDADGRDVSAEMLREGQAYHYKRYSTDPQLAAAERDARRDKRGLWAMSRREKPWVYRRRTAGTATRPDAHARQTKSRIGLPRPSLTSRKQVSRAKTWPSKTSGHTHLATPASSTHDNKVYVRSYTRADGTKVSGYWRSTPTRPSGTAAAGNTTGHGAGAGAVSVRGYYRANGTYVRGYSRAAPSRGGGRGR